MEKKVLLWLAAAVALTSCSNEEVMEQNLGKGISFRTAVSRATETTIDNLHSFYVTSFIDGDNTPYFNDVLYTGSGGYTSTIQYYWPGSSTLKFYAYAPSIDELQGDNVTSTRLDNYAGNVKLLQFSPDADIAKQVDFISANATGSKDKNESTGVELEFKHNLSQVAILARNSSDMNNFTYEVKGVKIARIKSLADFDFAANEWDLYDNSLTDYTINLSESVELNDQPQDIMNSDVNGTAMLIPQELGVWNPVTDKTNEQEGAYIAVKIRVSSNGTQIFPSESGKYAWVAVPITYEGDLERTWMAGCKYTFLLDFSYGAGLIEPTSGDERGGTSTDPELAENPGECGENVLGGPIEFTASLTRWDDDHGAPLAVSPDNDAY